MSGHQVAAKVPPQATDLEEVVLGALMLEKDCFHRIESILTAESFYLDAHQLIFETIQALDKKKAPIDIITVTQELKDNGKLDQIINGPYYITQLTSRVSSAANIEYQAGIIQEKYLKRQLIALSSATQSEAYDEHEDVFDTIEKFNNELNKLSDVSAVGDESGDLTKDLLAAISAIENTKEEYGVTGVPTGFRELDKITAGWQNGDLIVLSGRPGMGKSSIALEFAMQAASKGFPGVYFSMEMKKMKLVMKMQANYSEIDHDQIKRNRLSQEDWIRLNDACQRLSELKLKIDDTPSIKVRTMKAKLRKLARQGLLKWAIVDYLQMMDGSEGVSSRSNREQEVSYISRSLKSLAMELNIPIIALASMSREVERRGGKKEPILSDLRESGNIESDADMVIFMHRPEYYDIMEDENGLSTKGLAQVIIAKFRDGGVGRLNLRFFQHISKFTDYNSEDFVITRDMTEGMEFGKVTVDDEAF